MQRDFPLAPMDTTLRVLTYIFGPFPLIPLGIAICFEGIIRYITLGFFLFLLAIWAHVWLWWRPQSFHFTSDALVIKWPTRTRNIPRSSVISATRMNAKAFKEMFGRAARVGAGGLWGGFGRLTTQKRGWTDLYVSSMSDWIVIELKEPRPLVITPHPRKDFLESFHAWMVTRPSDPSNLRPQQDPSGS